MQVLLKYTSCMFLWLLHKIFSLSTFPSKITGSVRSIPLFLLHAGNPLVWRKKKRRRKESKDQHLRFYFQLFTEADTQFRISSFLKPPTFLMSKSTGTDKFKIQYIKVNKTLFSCKSFAWLTASNLWQTDITKFFILLLRCFSGFHCSFFNVFVCFGCLLAALLFSK